MGKRGPRPLTTRMLQLRGSWRTGLNRGEPTLPPELPECPEWIDPDAKQLWAETAPLLAQMRILTRADRQALARYCQTWSRWRKAEMFIQKYGESYPLKDDQGRVKCFMPWPQVAIAHKLAQTLARLEQEFGMTPSARTRIDVNCGPREHSSSTPEDAEWSAARANFFRSGTRGTPPPRATG